MMKFIDNNHVIVVCVHTFPKFLTVKGLYRNEKMFCRGRSISTHCQFTKVCIFQNLSETCLALF